MSSHTRPKAEARRTLSVKSMVLAVLVQRLLQGHSPLQSWAVACSWKGR